MTRTCLRLLLVTPVLLAGIESVAQVHANQASPNQSPSQLVKDVIYNEIHPPANSGFHWKYKAEKQVDGRRETRVVVETASGSLDRLVMTSGKPLSSAQENTESERILQFSRDQEQQRRAERARQKDAQQCDQIMGMIPTAFVFSEAGSSGNAVKIAFKPDPQFRPSSREGKVLQQMSGELWVDRQQKRLISISGRLTGDVKFGGGLLGHLEKGGQFNVKRAEIAPGDWELTEMVVDMHGKALLFKSISVQQRELHKDFERVPDDLTLADAASLLLRQATVASSLPPQ